MTAGLVLDWARILVPEVISLVKAHQAATGETPTAEQALAALEADAAAVIRVGQAWLAAHPPAAAD